MLVTACAEVTVEIDTSGTKRKGRRKGQSPTFCRKRLKKSEKGRDQILVIERIATFQ